MDAPDSGFSAPGFAWDSALPPPIRSMWAEICQALKAGSFTLVAHGTRTLVDRVAQDLVGVTRSFAQGVEALENRGLISSQDKDRLHVVVEAGNAAAHRELDLNKDQAQVLVHITENLLRSAYLPQQAVDSLRATIPPRAQHRRR